ncbi:MAG: carboxypeptidase M32 [Pseudomonadota bacterium]
MPDSLSPSAYSDLEARFAKIADIDNAIGILDWDQETTMPDGAGPARAQTLATLAVIRHGMITDAGLADQLGEAESEALDRWRTANVREMRRQWAHASAVPADLVEASTRASSTCVQAWRDARANGDFAALLPQLSEVLRLQREIAEVKGAAMGLSPYDALLDSYEPDGRNADVEAVFGPLEEFLPDFIGQALDAQAARPSPIALHGPFPTDAQRELGKRLMGIVGFDFDRGRLDESTHPFCGGADDDVRITTRYAEDDFTSALMGVMHETGHALYEQGLPADWSRQPVGQSRGMSLHESQSLLVEMQACRSRPFLAFVAPLAREAFGIAAEEAAWQPDNLYRLYTKVERGFIRVDADEVTYPAHVILRTKLERALLSGDLALPDLPGAWNDGMETLLGIRPENDRLGCLQDIHWPGGAFGYFPTYTLGAMTAAQLFRAAIDQVPEIPEAMTKGDFSPLITWLREKVHSQASLMSGSDLLTQATGKPLDAAVFKDHLKARYLDDA